MPRHRAFFKTRLLGSPDQRRFVIQDNRRQIDMFWTGRAWSRRLRDARLYADPEDVARTIACLTRRHLRRHEPRRVYLLTVVVSVNADKTVSREDVERYLRDSLVVGVNHDRCGLGPTSGSLVEVSVPVISLEEGC